MTFEEWSIGWNIPQTVDSEVYAMAHEAWNFNGGQERQAAHAEGVAEGRAAERERWTKECTKRARRFRSIDRRGFSPEAVSCANVLESLCDDMEKKSTDDPR